MYQLKSLVLAGRVLEGIQPVLLESLKDMIREQALFSVFSVDCNRLKEEKHRAGI